MDDSICFVMPVYNEGALASAFINQIEKSLNELAIFDTKYVCVNDNSTDNTLDFLEQLSASGLSLTIISNDSNLGHGPTTLRGINAGIATQSRLIVTIDSDMQFEPKEVAQNCKWAKSKTSDVIECVRTQRVEPSFRRTTSHITKLLLLIRTHSYVQDPNTPFRIYRNESLRKCLGHVPHNSLVPNLHLSYVTRALKMQIDSSKVKFIPKYSPGTMFGESKNSVYPTKKFLMFCFRATIEWTLCSPIFKRIANRMNQD